MQKLGYYIAGPMTGIPEFNFPAFDECAKYIREYLGATCVSPAEMDRNDGFDENGKTGNETLTKNMIRRFARNDIAALLNVKEIVLLPGWKNSTGAKNEALIAGWLGLGGLEYDPNGRSGHRFSPITLDGSWSSHPASPSQKPESPQSEYINARAEVLLGAEKLVNGDRNNQYGDPRQDFERTAALWSAFKGVKFDMHDVAAFMCLLKLSRISWQPTKLDSWMDLAGYSACGFETTLPESYFEALKAKANS